MAFDLDVPMDPNFESHTKLSLVDSIYARISLKKSVGSLESVRRLTCVRIFCTIFVLFVSNTEYF